MAYFRASKGTTSREDVDMSWNTDCKWRHKSCARSDCRRNVHSASTTARQNGMGRVLCLL